MFEYRDGAADLDVAVVAQLYDRSTLGERRPFDDLARLGAVLAESNLVISAWDSNQLVGIARSLTDRRWVTYLADLAVDVAFQHRGVGRELITRTRNAAPEAKIVLLAAPASREYYAKVGFEHHNSAWTLPPLFSR